MALTGQDKTDYQREYMRKRRSNAGSNEIPVSVRPEQPDAVRPVRPLGLSDNQWNYVKWKASINEALEVDNG